jgi:hypothetical protein
MLFTELYNSDNMSHFGFKVGVYSMTNKIPFLDKNLLKPYNYYSENNVNPLYYFQLKNPAEKNLKHKEETRGNLLYLNYKNDNKIDNYFSVLDIINFLSLNNGSSIFYYTGCRTIIETDITSQELIKHLQESSIQQEQNRNLKYTSSLRSGS